MANTKISALSALGATPASGDIIAIVDVSDTSQAASGSTKKLTTQYIAVTDGNVCLVTGGGTIALGGFTLTVPATGTAALSASANTFTTVQAITPAGTGVNGLTVNMPTSTSGIATEWKYNSTQRAKLSITSTDTFFSLPSFDNGSSFGCRMFVGRNSHAGTESGGFILLEAANTDFFPLFMDASGNLRTASANVQPTSGTTGTVVGTQTSSLSSKNISDTLPDSQTSLTHIVNAAKNGLRAWSYKTGAYNNEFFPCGIVTDYAPRYGMDRDAEHPHGKSLNVPVAIGDLIASIAILNERLEQLENKLN